VADLIDRQALTREEDLAGFLDLRWIGSAQLYSLSLGKEKTLWLADASAFAVFTSVLIRNAPAVSQSATGGKILSCGATHPPKCDPKPGLSGHSSLYRACCCTAQARSFRRQNQPRWAGTGETA
jgi:hypothetical protein